MTWFVPTNRDYHPCLLPFVRDHRAGEFWRCEVCNDLWRLSSRGLLVQATRWERWRFRKYGYGRTSSDQVS